MPRVEFAQPAPHLVATADIERGGLDRRAFSRAFGRDRAQSLGTAAEQGQLPARLRIGAGDRAADAA